MTTKSGRATEPPRFYGLCNGGPLNGQPFAHTLPTREFGEWTNPPSNVIVVGEPEHPQPKMIVNRTGYYSWSYINKQWDWVARP